MSHHRPNACQRAFFTKTIRMLMRPEGRAPGQCQAALNYFW